MTEGEERALVRNAQSAVDGVLVLSSARLLMVTINIYYAVQFLLDSFLVDLWKKKQKKNKTKKGEERRKC